MEAMLESDHYDEWGEVPEVAVVIIFFFFFIVPSSSAGTCRKLHLEKTGGLAASASLVNMRNMALPRNWYTKNKKKKTVQMGAKHFTRARVGSNAVVHGG